MKRTKPNMKHGLRHLSLLLALLPLFLLTGCSRSIKVEITNDFAFPIEIYDATRLAPVKPYVIGTVLPHATLEEHLYRIGDRGTYHLIIKDARGRPVQDVKAPSGTINALKGPVWNLTIGP